MSPGDKTKAYIDARLSKLPASKRPDDRQAWVRSIAGLFLIAVGCIVLVIRVLMGVEFTSWQSILPSGVPIAAGLFLFDPKHVLDVVKAGRKHD